MLGQAQLAVADFLDDRFQPKHRLLCWWLDSWFVSYLLSNLMVVRSSSWLHFAKWMLENSRQALMSKWVWNLYGCLWSSPWDQSILLQAMASMIWINDSFEAKSIHLLMIPRELSSLLPVPSLVQDSFGIAYSWSQLFSHVVKFIHLDQHLDWERKWQELLCQLKQIDRPWKSKDSWRILDQEYRQHNLWGRRPTIAAWSIW